jgi:phosphopantetheinyl transferase
MGALGITAGILSDSAPGDGVRRVNCAFVREFLHGSLPVSYAVTHLFSALPYSGAAVCCRVDRADSTVLPLADLVLSPAERQQWASMRAVEKRLQEWLLGRLAAKDAVRRLLAENLGLNLAPTEIEIVPDSYGRPRATGAWTSWLPAEPPISIAHSDGTAVALAVLDPGQLAGIDLENLRRRREHFEAIAFRAEERDLLAAMPEDLRQEWALRLWCAKEAVGKALGRGLSAGLLAFEVTEVEMGTGRIQVMLRDGAREQCPRWHGRPLPVSTTRDTEFVFATIICQRGAVS